MKRKIFSVLFALVLVFSFSLVTAVPAAAQETAELTLITYESGVAESSTVQARSGTSSIYLNAGPPDSGSVGRIELVVATPVPIADFTGASFYVWEPSGIQHGGQWPGEWDIPMPWGDPYINILLDTDGDGFFDDGLEGIGSTEGIVRPATHPASTTEQWVEMEEAYGFYTSEDTICGLESPYPTGYDVEHDAVTYDQAGTLEEWQAWFATNAPTVTVVGVQITFGWWLHDPVEGVYVDDVTVNGLTYNLETEGSVGLTVDIPEITAISVTPTSINFGTLYPGDSSGITTLTVENIGTVTVDVADWVAPAETVFDNLLVGKALELVPVGSETDPVTVITGLVGKTSSEVAVQLVVPSDYSAKGVESATLIFEVTAAP